MAVMADFYCDVCGDEYLDGWTDQVPVCGDCGSRMRRMLNRINTKPDPMLRAPHVYGDYKLRPRSEIDAFAKANGCEVSGSAEKFGGARNEEHLNLKKCFSYRGAPARSRN